MSKNQSRCHPELAKDPVNVTNSDTRFFADAQNDNGTCIPSLPSPKIQGLYAIVDNQFTPELSHFEIASRILFGGCKILQLRIKRESPSLWDDEAFEVAKEIMTLKKKFDFTFIVNDYVDVAAELKVDGVHVGENDMSVDEIKKRSGGKLLVGYSSHSIDEAVKAELKGADYVALGAIFPTVTKGPGHPVQGLPKLKELISRVTIPTVAIGGINRTNIKDVIATGASSVAMITGLTKAEDITLETRWYVNSI